MTSAEARLLHILIDKLPSEWTREYRKRWLRAMIRSVDLIVGRSATR